VICLVEIQEKEVATGIKEIHFRKETNQQYAPYFVWALKNTGNG